MPDRDDSQKPHWSKIAAELPTWFGGCISCTRRALRQTMSRLTFRKSRTSVAKTILIKDSARTKVGKRTKRVHFMLPKPRSSSILRPLHPDSKLVHHWANAMVFPLSYEIWAFPFRLAFGIPKFNAVMQTDILFDFAFFVDAVVKCSTTVPAGTLPDQDAAITTFRGIASVYLKRQLLWDFVPPGIYYLFTAVSTVLGLDERAVLWLWWLSMLPRMLVRSMRLTNYFRDMSTNLKINVRVIETVKFMMMIFLSSHWIGCVMFWISRLYSHDASTWVEAFSSVLPLFNKNEVGTGSMYLICVYSGFNLISGLGYTYGMPHNLLEIIWRLITMIFQVYLSSLILGSLLNYIVRNSPEEVAYKGRMDEMVAYVQRHKIPPDVAANIYSFMEFQHKKQAKKHLHGLVTLPKPLLVKASNHQYHTLVEKCASKGKPFFGCSTMFLDELLISMVPLHLHPGEHVAKKDDIAWQLYLVADGAVSLMDDENRVVAVIRSDVPDMAPLAGHVPFFIRMFHAYHIRAQHDGEAQLLVLDKEESERLFKMFPGDVQTIRENILASFGLDADGRDQSAEADGEPDTERLTEERALIQAAIQDQNYRSYAVFFSAVENGDVQTVLAFLARGMDPDSASCDRLSALHLASLRGRHQVVSALLDHGAQINAKDMWGHTPLWYAISKKLDLVAAMLKERNAALELPRPEDSLWEAAASGNLEMVRTLVANKVDPNIQTCDGRSALHVSAAEGMEDVVELLLRQGADINAKDRFGGTPLKDAVMGGHNLLASIMRSKGALLPEGMGADLLCAAASDGNIPLLQLLFECEMDMNVGDYDRRRPLHLAAAEARVLAVSFLLSHTARPNAEDRWGGRAIDDALHGGTKYHMYCAKLIQCWGGKVGTFDTASEKGKKRMEELDAIDITDAFNLVEKLLKLGFARKKIDRVSEQDILTCFDSVAGSVPVVKELRVNAGRLGSTLRHQKTMLSKTIKGVGDILAQLPKGGAVLKRQGTRKEGGPFSVARILKLNTMRSRRLSEHSLDRESNASSPKLRGEDSDGSDAEELDASLYDPLNALEPEEEEELHMEVDRMQDVMQRCFDTGQTAPQLGAQAFHKASVQVKTICDSIQVLLAAFIDLRAEEMSAAAAQSAPEPEKDSFSRVGSSIARTQSQGGGWARRMSSGNAAPSKVPKSALSRLPSDPRRRVQVDGLTRLASNHGARPSKTSEEDEEKRDEEFEPEELAAASEDILWKMMTWLGVVAYGDEVEEIMEEAQGFVLFEQEAEENKQKKKPGESQIVNQSLQPPDEEAVADNKSQTHTPQIVPLEAVLAGSRRFRALCESLQIDTNLCKILESSLSTILSEDECRRLVVVDTLDVKEGVLSLCEDGHDSEVWYVLLDGVLDVRDIEHVRRREATEPPPRVQARSFNAGTPFGAWGTLVGAEAHTSVTAVCNCKLLCIEMDSLGLLVSSRPELQVALARLMAEAPAPDQAEAVYSISAQSLPNPSHFGHSEASAVAQAQAADAQNDSSLVKARRTSSVVRSLPGSLPGDGTTEILRAGELTRLQLKQIMLLLDDLWRCLSMGSDKVPLSVLSGIGAKLGEAGNETFRKVFWFEEDELLREQGCLTETDYWRRWLMFVAEDNRQVSDDVEAEKSEAAMEEEEDADGMTLADQDEGTGMRLWDRIYSSFSTAHSLKPRFYDPSVIDIYEVAYEQVVGDLRKPLPRKKAVEFLSQIFVDFPYEISARNVREFFMEFSSEEGARTMSITWVQIRNVLREHRMGVTSREDRLFNGTALNPRSKFHAAWRILIRICAVYYVVMVPVRAAFLPWDGMIHSTSLATDAPVDILVLLHLFVCANTSYRNSRSVWVTNRFKIMRKVPFAVILAAIPLDWFAFNAGASDEDAVFYRIPKMLLILAMPRTSSTSQNSTRKKVTTMVYVVALLVHVGTCIWFYLGRAYHRWASPAISWYRTEDAYADVSFPRTGFGWDDHDSTLQKYMVSLYWVASTFTVNGIVGQVIPQNLHECVFAIILMVASLTLYQWTIGEISSIIMNADMHLVRRREEHSVLNNYIHANKLPQNIGQEILNNFNASRDSAVGAQSEAFRNINLRLKTEISSFLYKEILENAVMFDGCSDGFMDAVCNITRVQEFTPEEVLFHKNDVVRDIFVVVSGSVEKYHGDKSEGPHLLVEEGQTLGELATVFGIPHMALAKAPHPRGCSCLCIRSEQFLDILQHYPHDEQCITNNALEAFEVKCQLLNTNRMSSRASHASTGVTSDGKLSSFQHSSAENGAALIPLHHEAASDLDADGSESDVASSTDGDVGKLLSVSLMQLKDRHSARMLHILHKAAADGDVERMKGLLSRMADKAFNQPNELQRTALHAAAVHGRVDVVQFLLDVGADPNSQDIHGNTPFNDAVLLGKDEVAERLRKAIADSKLQLPPAKMSGLLTQAAATGNSSEMKRLLENKADINCANTDQRTALHVAATAGHGDVVELLLSSNADATLRDKMGWTALDCAVLMGQRAVQDLMNSKGVTMAGERNMETVCNLCELASKGEVDKIKDLVRNGADVGMGDYDMRTPLHLAASCGELAVLDYLLKLKPKINLNCMDRFGGTPLDDALRHQNRAAAAALEEKGALSMVDPNQSSLLEEQKQKLEQLLKQTRGPLVLKTVQESDEVAMCTYLREDLAPTFERLGQALHEALRGVLHSLQSVAAAIREQENKRAAASAAMSSAMVVAKMTANKRLGGGKNAWLAIGPSGAGQSIGEHEPKDLSDSPPLSEDPTVGGISSSASVTDPAYGGNEAPTADNMNQKDIMVVRPDRRAALPENWRLLDRSLENGWRAESGEDSSAPSGGGSSAPNSEGQVDEFGPLQRTASGDTAPRAPSATPGAEPGREDAVLGVREVAVLGEVVAIAPQAETASLVSVKADPPLSELSELSEAAKGGGAEDGEPARKFWRQLQPQIEIPGVVDEPAPPDKAHVSSVFVGVLEHQLMKQRAEPDQSKDGEGSDGVKEEEEPYDKDIQRLYQIFSKRLLELHQEDEKVDQIAPGAFEEWFEYVLNDLQALSKAISALRLEIDATCNHVPQGLNGATRKTKAAGVWRMVMRQAWAEMQSQRELLGECKKLYKTLRREVNSLMKSRKTAGHGNGHGAFKHHNNVSSTRAAVSSPLVAASGVRSL